MSPSTLIFVIITAAVARYAVATVQLTGGYVAIVELVKELVNSNKMDAKLINNRINRTHVKVEGSIQVLEKIEAPISTRTKMQYWTSQGWKSYNMDSTLVIRECPDEQISDIASWFTPNLSEDCTLKIGTAEWDPHRTRELKCPGDMCPIGRFNITYELLEKTEKLLAFEIIVNISKDLAKQL